MQLSCRERVRKLRTSSPPKTMATDSLYKQGKMESVHCTIKLTRIEADITSLLLGIDAPTELCYQKCRRIQACSHNQAGIHQGIGGGATTMLEWYNTGQVQSSRHEGKNPGDTVTHRLPLSSSLSLLHATSMRHRCCPSSSTALRLSSCRSI